MIQGNQPRGSDQRKSARVATQLTVRVGMPNSDVKVEKISNMSLGGVFIEMPGKPLSFGTQLTLEFKLGPEGMTLRCQGTVVWSTHTRPDPSGKSGVGVRLNGLGIAEMQSLADYLNGLQTGR